MPIQVEILITAPNGCSSAIELLKCLDYQVKSGFKVKVLETHGKCDLQRFFPRNFQLEHKYFVSQEEARMRCEGFVTSEADWIVVLEDHVLISKNFINELSKFIEHKGAADAATFYAINGTTKSFGSRSLFSWVWGLAESPRFPEKPEPVCSAFAVKRSAVLNLIAKRGNELAVGELESQIIPELIKSSDSKFVTFMEVSHFEYVGILVGAKAIFSNSRIMGHLEKSLLSWRNWIRNLMCRFFTRPKQIKRVTQKSWIEMVCLYFLAMVGFTGYLIGGLLGFGKADQTLAAAHPKIMKE